MTHRFFFSSKNPKYTLSQLQTVYAFINEKSSLEIAQHLGITTLDIMNIKIKLLNMKRIKVENSAYVKLPWTPKESKKVLKKNG